MAISVDSNSKVKLSITLVGEGAVIERLADLRSHLFDDAERPSLPEPTPRLEDTPPAVSIAPRRRLNNGHRH
jgi:hypothetical protein